MEGHEKKVRPWLMWLSELSAGLRTKGLLVRFLVRVQVWIAGRVSLWWGVCERQPHIHVSLPLFVPPFPPL